jgi:hypothetical protein
MSHEGIRIAPKNQESEAELPLPRISVTPEKVRVLITEGKGMEIDWADGHRSAWSFAWLRDACPCATCVEERKVDGRKGRPPSYLCILRPPNRLARRQWVATPSSSIGRMATPAESILGIICAASASATNVPLPPGKQPARPTKSLKPI